MSPRIRPIAPVPAFGAPAARRRPPLSRRVRALVETGAARAFVGTMIGSLARGLCAASRSDPQVKRELEGFADGFTFEMLVLPSGPRLRLRKTAGALVFDPETSRPTLAIQIKHLRHAVALLSFAETTPDALARSRMIIDGDPAQAMRMQRILDRVMVLLLSRPVAARALRRPIAGRPLDDARDAARFLYEMLAPAGR